MLDYTAIRTVQQLHQGHWFDADTLRFFKSRISQTAVKYGSGWLFVSSERFDYATPRYYSVRFCASDGGIDTVGEFQQYATGAQAWAAIRKLVKGGL